MTRTEDKEIEEAFVLLKNAVGGGEGRERISLEFTTSLVQIVQAYLMGSD